MFPGSRHSFVAPAGDGAVLKVRPPDDEESLEEADALELWAGNGAIRLLRHDRHRHALLVERAFPGSDLAGLPENEATAVAVAVAERLWRRGSAQFRWIGDYVPRWLDDADAAGGTLVPLARTLYASLDVGRGTLVHGDFHHHNLLLQGDRYVAIDPKPMLGEPEFDVYPFLRNPIAQQMEPDVVERRIAAFAASGLDEGRIRAWAVIRSAYLCTDRHVLQTLRALV